MTKFKTLLVAGTFLATLSTHVFAAGFEFKSIDAPTDDAAKRQVVTTKSVTIDGKEIAVQYNVLSRSGQKFDGKAFGALVATNGANITNGDGTPMISDSADFTSLLTVGKKIYSITHFESLPAAMYLSELSQGADGKLTTISTRPIDFSALGGLWQPCAGSVTPWGTHLGSEEYPTDARSIEAAVGYGDLDGEILPMLKYVGIDTDLAPIAAFKAAFQPYKYGFPVEISVTESGETSVAKHFAMGRVSVELASIMPDKKTAYISDDGTNVGLFRFVADNEGDLSAGRLFAAKWTQTSAEGAGAADITWIDLGHSSDNEISGAVKFGVKFSDMFETAKFKDDGSCPAGFLSSNADGRSECLKVKPGMEAYASRLETRRYASMMGATTEFRKMEGMAIDDKNKRLYLSMTEISNGMEDSIKDGKFDKGGRNDIKLGKNPCGAVYELPYDANYILTNAKSFLVGKPVELKEGPFAGQSCDIDGISNPDNLTFVPGYNTLLIGEDTTAGHQNDAAWSVNTKTKAMTRFMTSPYGSEITGLDFYSDVNGFAYITAVVQHPYGESDQDKLQKPEDARAYVGYFGPLPAIKK